MHIVIRERKIVDMITVKSTLPGTCSVKDAFPSLTIIPFQAEAECCSWHRRKKYFLKEYCQRVLSGLTCHFADMHDYHRFDHGFGGMSRERLPSQFTAAPILETGRGVDCSYRSRTNLCSLILEYLCDNISPLGLWLKRLMFIT